MEMWQTLLQFICQVAGCCKPEIRLGFSKITIDNTIIIEGKDINMIKLEFDQSVTFGATGFTDRRGRAAKIEEGSALWSVVAVGADGEDISETVLLEVAEDNELFATLTVGDVEGVVTVVMEADGDSDADEYTKIMATATVVVDAPNVVAFDLTMGEPVDVEDEPVEEEPAPAEEAPEEEAPAEEPTDETPVEETPETPPTETPVEPTEGEDMPPAPTPGAGTPTTETPAEGDEGTR